MIIEPSSDEDLHQVLDWLKQERVHEGFGFYSNANLIENGHAAGDELFVLKAGPAVAAFVLGRPGSIDIFETRPDLRGCGYGRILANFCIDRGYHADIAVMEFECSPETSLPFWKKVGFSERPAPWGDGTWVMKMMAKRLDLPDGDPTEVTIKILSEEYAWSDNNEAIYEYRQRAIVDQSGVIWLPTRVVIFAPELPRNMDVAVEIVVDGVRRIIGKAKYEEPRNAGVLRDRGGNFYIDKIIPSSSP